MSESNWPDEKQELSDGTVFLRTWQFDDVQRLWEICRDPDVQRWVGIPVPYGLEDANNFITKLAVEEWGEQTGVHFAIVDATSGAIAGCCGATLNDSASKVAEAGYYCAPEWRNRGLTRRALSLLSSWILETLKWERVEVLIETENLGSSRVALGAGYELEGALKRKSLFCGEQRDMAIYVMVHPPSSTVNR